MKYCDTAIVMREFPGEITLALNISNCPNHCEGCHTAYLRNDIGTILIYGECERLVKANPGVSCIGIMGGDKDHADVNRVASFFKELGKKVGWYSGCDYLDLKDIDLRNFDYIKIGSWQADRGPLNEKTTNQVMFRVNDLRLEMVDMSVKES